MTHWSRYVVQCQERYRVILFLVLISSNMSLVILLQRYNHLQRDFRDNITICDTVLNYAHDPKFEEFIQEAKVTNVTLRDALVREIHNRCLHDENVRGLQSYDHMISDALRRLTRQQQPSNHTSVVPAAHNDSGSPPPMVNSNSSSSDLTKQSAGSVELFLSQPIINPFDYEYVINQSEACSDSDVTVKFILAVSSATGNFHKRQKLRDHQAGQFTKDAKNRAKLLFFLGSIPPNAEEAQTKQNEIQQEQATYGDIVQFSFIDSYDNMSIKSAMICKWSSTSCDKSTFVLRFDDDLRLNFPEMAEAMEEETKQNDTDNSSHHHHHVILGTLVKNRSPNRDPKNKYYTSKEAYPYDKLPDFLQGAAVGFSVQTAALLFQASQRVPLFRLEDVYLTGMCAPKVGVAIQHSPAFKYKHYRG